MYSVHVYGIADNEPYDYCEEFNDLEEAIKCYHKEKNKNEHFEVYLYAVLMTHCIL
jgi:hypothetical protein